MEPDEPLDFEHADDFEIDTAAEALLIEDPSPFARIEPKPMSDEVVTPLEFSRTTDILSEGIGQLREQLVMQAGRLEAIVNQLGRLDELLVENREDGSRAEAIEQSLDSIRSEHVETTAAVDGLRSQLLDWQESVHRRFEAVAADFDGAATRLIAIQQNQVAQADQLKSQEGALQQVGQRLATFEHAHRETVKTVQQSIDRLSLEVAALDRRASMTRGLVVLAAVAATTAAILGLVSLIAA